MNHFPFACWRDAFCLQLSQPVVDPVKHFVLSFWGGLFCLKVGCLMADICGLVKRFVLSDWMGMLCLSGSLLVYCSDLVNR